MIRKKIELEMMLQKRSQKSMVKAVKDKGLKATPAQISNFLNGKLLLNIPVVEVMLEELSLDIVKTP